MKRLYEKTTWVNASRKNPCPICGRRDGCRISPDGIKVLCHRVPSDDEKPNSLGWPWWMHTVGETVAQAPPTSRQKKRQRVSLRRWRDICHAAESRVDPDALSIMGHFLGLSVTSLRSMAIGQAEDQNWMFPMRDAKQRIVGVRVRACSGSADKWSLPGSDGHGLFIPQGSPVGCHTVWIVEGPTDCAAMLDAGMASRMKYGGHAVIGRSSCWTGLPYIRAWALYRNVVIIADNDPPKTRPDGSDHYPGWEGARQLADDLVEHVRSLAIIMPPDHKDIRQWLQDTKHPLKMEYMDAMQRGEYGRKFFWQSP